MAIETEVAGRNRKPELCETLRPFLTLLFTPQRITRHFAG
jgi:hypothetical protein